MGPPYRAAPERIIAPGLYKRPVTPSVYRGGIGASRLPFVVISGIALRRQLCRPSGVRLAAQLKALTGIGVLREQAFGREKLFVNSRLVSLLTKEGDARGGG